MPSLITTNFGLESVSLNICPSTWNYIGKPYHLKTIYKQISETYECEDYKSYIRNKIQYLQKNAWKQLLEEGEAHKKAMAMVLTNIAAVEDVESFMNDFCQTLKGLFFNSMSEENCDRTQFTNGEFEERNDNLHYSDFFSSQTIGGSI